MRIGETSAGETGAAAPDARSEENADVQARHDLSEGVCLQITILAHPGGCSTIRAVG